MKVAFYVHQITPHLMPIARELAHKFGKDEVRYVYCNPLETARKNLGWDGVGESWVLCEKDDPKEARRWLLGADLLYCEYRDLDLWAARTESGKGLYYTSERWYKPIILMYVCGREIALPGVLRLLHPRYLRMAKRAVELFARGKIVNLVNGPHCARDFLRTVGIFTGDWRCLFRAPKITFKQRPMGAIFFRGKIVENVRMWGYFVATTTETAARCEQSERPKVLWVGRYLDLKRVDTLIKAARGAPFDLSLYGAGPEEWKLKSLAKDCENISFHQPVSVLEVRKLMRSHDVYAFPSNGREGWGAVVNEALEEGMRVLGSYEAGASAAILPEANLFHCWDWRHLRKLILANASFNEIGCWSVRSAADVLVKDACHVAD